MPENFRGAETGDIFDINGLLVGSIPGEPGIALTLSGQAAANYVTSRGGTVTSGSPPPGGPPL